MPKIAQELRPATVKALARKPGTYTVGGVVGLQLQVTASAATPPGPPTASWILRRTVAGLGRLKVGLGSFSDVPLTTAREEARKLAERIAVGGNPLEDRKAARMAAQREVRSSETFKQATERHIEAMEASWTNDKSPAQWRATMETYAYAVIGDMQVGDIALADVLTILQPIWIEKYPTATKVRQRIEAIIRAADSRAGRHRINPAALKGNLDTQLPDRGKGKGKHERKHHEALPIDDMPGFMTKLRQVEGLTARALELVVLTAKRVSEVREAEWHEFDLDKALWVIPRERTKSGNTDRVPLSAAAVNLLRAQPHLPRGTPGGKYVFPAAEGKPLSEDAMRMTMRRMGLTATPHGFRSSFADWADERAGYPHELIELALAHTVGSAVARAYRRNDGLERRRELATAWAGFCDGKASGSNVVQIKKAANT